MTRELRPGHDRHVLRAAVGVVCRDVLDRRLVADGLVVELDDPRRPGRAQRLAANGQGVFVAHSLPRWRPAVPIHDDEDEVTASPPDTRRLRIRVRDTHARYLPLRLDADLPAHALFEPPCLGVSPPEMAPHLPLFSATTRTLPAGLATVRAQLRRAAQPDLPLAWARLEVWVDGRMLAEGLSDERGSLLLPCPMPAPPEPLLNASPPTLGTTQHTWPLQLRAYWRVPPAGEGGAPAAAGPPDLCQLWQMPEVPLQPHAFVLRAGEPLVARSPGSSYLFAGA